MSTRVSVGLRADGTAEVLAALRSVRQEVTALETHSIASAKKASAARLAILKDEINKSKALRSELADDEPTGGKGGGGGGGKGGGPSAWGIAGAAEALRRGLDIATSALKQFGGFVLNDVIRPAMQLQTRAQQVANASGGKLSAEDVLGTSRAVGLKNNMDPEALMNAAGVFQDATGESKMGFDMLNVIGTLSKARGYDPTQLAGMAGAVYKQGMSTADLEKILLMQTAQGDKGSVTLGEMARLGGKLTAPAASFAGDYATRIAMSGALLQSSRRGFGSTDEAATGLASFTNDALKAGKRFSPTAIVKNEAGVEQITDPAKLISDIFLKTSGNATALRSAGFSDPSMKLIGAFQERFSEAYGAAKGEGASDTEAKEKAAGAVEEFVKSFVTANTTMEAESAKRDAVMQTSGEKWDSAVNKVKDRLLGMMPSVDKFIDVFASNSDNIGKAMDVLVQAALLAAKGLGWIGEAFQAKSDADAKEGDVVRRVEDKGKDTSLPLVTTAQGYYRKGDSGFEFVKSEKMAPDDETSGKWRPAGKNGDLVFYPEDKLPENEARKLYAPDASDALRIKQADEARAMYAPTAANGDVGGDGSSKITEGASDASAAMKQLKSAVDDVTSSVRELNRSQAFTGKQ